MKQNSDPYRLAILQRRAQGYFAQGARRGDHLRVKRALRLLTLAHERGSDIAAKNREQRK
jgi:hypothetical protein